ncbi:MAG: carbonic anhydrase [Legionellaceae bacterium]|nr:carbonic anhydrase [Legionellaceae bacterium]
MPTTKLLTLAFSLALTHSAYSADTATSAEKQANMTPKQALLKLKAGNKRFISGKMQKQHYLKQAKKGASGQFPWALVLNCMDSRSVPEFFFNQGLTDLFTLRVAGNVLNEDILGSMEYATKAAGTRLIVVLGHTSCGAVKAACEHTHFGHIDHFTHKIVPVIPESKKESGTNNCADPKLITKIAENNALKIAREIPEKSPIIRKLIEENKIGIVAGIHDVKTGKVTFFEEGRLMPAEEKKP